MYINHNQISKPKLKEKTILSIVFVHVIAVPMKDKKSLIIVKHFKENIKYNKFPF